MKFDGSSSNIVLISYPPGGYGHFLYHALTQFFLGTVKISDPDFELIPGATAHAARKYNQVWNPGIGLDYDFEMAVPFSADQRILVLCDHGYGKDDYKVLDQLFPCATVIRVVSRGRAEPVIYKTYTQKTQNHFDHLTNTQQHWGTTEDWAVRENYTLWYHNRPWQFDPVNQPKFVNIDLFDLVTQPTAALINLGQRLGISVRDRGTLATHCRKWLRSQSNYLKIVTVARRLIHSIDNPAVDVNLGSVLDLHDQGYLNYCIERHCGISIPVMDYANWFDSAAAVRAMILRVRS